MATLYSWENYSGNICMVESPFRQNRPALAETDFQLDNFAIERAYLEFIISQKLVETDQTCASFESRFIMLDYKILLSICPSKSSIIEISWNYHQHRGNRYYQ